SGRAAAASAVFDSVAAHAQNFDPEDLFTAGQRLMSQRWYRAGARALALALTKNPYRRDALYSLGVGYYQLRDSTNLLAVAQRLVQLDPLNRSSIRLLAAAWDLRGRRYRRCCAILGTSTEVPACVEVATLGFTKSLKSR